MPVDPLTGSRYPTRSAAPDVAQDIQNAVFDLADNTIPRFPSTTARNTAYTAWTAAGGVMADGMFCVVNADLYKYLSGAWKVVPTDYQVRAMRAQRTTVAPFVNDAWTAFTDNTNWTETDPWGMRGSGALFVAPFTGVYQLNVILTFNNNATGRRGIRLKPSSGVNIGAGGGGTVTLTEISAASGGFDTTISGSHMTALTAGNTVQVEAIQNSGGSLDVNRIFISAAYLGPNT